MSTCRVCGGYLEPAGNPLIKYSLRHYAHAECGLKKWGDAFFDRMHPWQARNFPYLTALRLGHERALVARAEQEEA